MATSRLCSIEDCGKPHAGRGYCWAHYERLMSHGDPLGGGTSKGELLRWIHDVALHHTGNECLIWPYGRRRGYGKLRVDGKLSDAHRYLCQLAHGDPPTPEHEAAHSCGNGDHGCVNPNHLDWKTRIENMADKLVHGTHTRGERNVQAKISEADAREIIALRGKALQKHIAKRFGISIAYVGKIQRGVSWSWLD